MQRLIDAPDSEWLNSRQAAAWLNVGLTLFRELLASGELPRPVVFGRRKAQRWHWRDVVAWAHLRSINRDGTGTTQRRRTAPE